MPTLLEKASRMISQIVRGSHVRGALGLDDARTAMGFDHEGRMAAATGTENTFVSARVVGDPQALQELFGLGSTFRIAARHGDEVSHGEIKF